MQKRIILLGLLIFIVMSSFATKPKPIKINWISLEKLQTLYTQNPKPIIIDVFTSWCGWCKAMDKDTYSNANVVKYINDHFYAVRFNAETKTNIIFNGKTYEYNAGLQVNDFANLLLNGQMSYPSTVILGSILDTPNAIAGYLKPSELELPLTYFGNGAYKKQDFNAYQKLFLTKW